MDNNMELKEIKKEYERIKDAFEKTEDLDKLNELFKKGHELQKRANALYDAHGNIRDAIPRDEIDSLVRQIGEKIVKKTNEIQPGTYATK